MKLFGEDREDRLNYLLIVLFSISIGILVEVEWYGAAVSSLLSFLLVRYK